MLKGYMGYAVILVTGRNRTNGANCRTVMGTPAPNRLALRHMVTIRPRASAKEGSIFPNEWSNDKWRVVVTI
jgi:hypothetical protein